MRPSNQRRFQRGRHPNNNRNSGNSGRQVNRNTSFESNGPNMRLRGTAQQLAEKYQQHARDAGANGDFVLRESFLQHAEYYYRMLEPMDQQNNSAETQNGEGDMNGGDAQADANQDNGGYENAQNSGGYDNNNRDNNNRGNESRGNNPRQRRRRWEMNGNGESNNADNNPASDNAVASDNEAVGDNNASTADTSDNSAPSATAAATKTADSTVARRTAVRRTVKKPASDTADPFKGDMPSFLSIDDK